MTIEQTGLWHWVDDVELTAFAGHDGKPVFLRWQHDERLVRKEELQPGDHVLFDAQGYVLELMRPRQKKLAPPPPVDPIKEAQRQKQLRAPWAYPGR